MTYALTPLSTIPDPTRSPSYYRGVPTRRALAWGIDTLFIGLLSLMVLPFTAFTGLLFFPMLMLVVGFFYRWFTISIGSATLGMRLMGIELREAWGQRLNAETAFWHTAGYTVCVLGAPLQLISVLFMGLSPRGQGLHDLMLNTVAINRRALRR